MSPEYGLISLALTAGLELGVSLPTTWPRFTIFSNPYDAVIDMSIGAHPDASSLVGFGLITALECLFAFRLVVSDGLGLMLESVDLRSQGWVFEVVFRDKLLAQATKTVKRFKDYINLVLLVDIDETEYSIEFVPMDEAERQQISVYKYTSSLDSICSDVPFSLIAQAMYAADISSEDPSFASTLAKMAREALSEKLFIEAFRYAFLLFEGLYGAGKFKTVQLVLAMSGASDFTAHTRE